MGILNITPDSFSDGGRLTSIESALKLARDMVSAGAQILDIGGESTRPGAIPVTATDESKRVLPVINALVAEKLPTILSIDTAKAEVAQAALQAGVHIVNDVTALGDQNMGRVIAKANAAVVLMHMRGEPRTMQEGEIIYNDVVADIRTYLANAINQAVAAGIKRERIMIDPGIGFGKTTQHNLTLTRHLGEFASLNCPIVYGPSRKRFLGEITSRPIYDRDRATAAVCALAIANGAHVLRVHDVNAVADAVKVAHAVANTT
ncbi:MAG: dihydropteroate synthase [Deltaproteobacteria bacterium]|nr:dihydropteroate synthase [Deltaproteobacteria bacterium]